jgi:iron complex transport system permease protein
MTTLTANRSPSRALRIVRSAPVLLVGMLICAGVLALALMSSIAFGAADIAPADVWQAIAAFNPESTEHLIIRTLRMPRAAVAALVGAALAVAGALMQGLTRNPLADPGILGIETGAALGVVAAVFFLGIGSLYLYALFAFAGAGLTTGRPRI